MKIYEVKDSKDDDWKCDWSLEHLLDEVSYEHKLAVTQWVMKHIVEHAIEGGSYRYLIYDRLGFDVDAYAPLCEHGLTISNQFDLSPEPEFTPNRDTSIENLHIYKKAVLKMASHRQKEVDDYIRIAKQAVEDDENNYYGRFAAMDTRNHYDSEVEDEL